MSVAENFIMIVYPWIGDPKTQRHYDNDQKRSHQIMEKISKKKAGQFSSLENRMTQAMYIHV